MEVGKLKTITLSCIIVISIIFPSVIVLNSLNPANPMTVKNGNVNYSWSGFLPSGSSSVLRLNATTSVAQFYEKGPPISTLQIKVSGTVNYMPDILLNVSISCNITSNFSPKSFTIIENSSGTGMKYNGVEGFYDQITQLEYPSSGVNISKVENLPAYYGYSSLKWTDTLLNQVNQSSLNQTYHFMWYSYLDITPRHLNGTNRPYSYGFIAELNGLPDPVTAALVLNVTNLVVG